MHADSIPLTAFRTRYGIYQYNVLPFGLCNGPATFQRYINEVLFDLLDECCTAYVDDILIYSQDALEHETHVRQVMQRLREAGLQVDIKKSEFSVTKTKFLGFIVSTKGIAVDPEKIEAITHWQTPETVRGIQSFLGFCNFFRRFIRGFGQIALPLVALTKKKQTWRWEEAQQEAFDQLKCALTNTPILVHFDPSRETILETDASGGVAAGVLSQKTDDGFFHPVAYFSKTLSGAEMRYDIHDKEMLAVILSLGKWRADLQSLRTPFLIITDHKALEYFSEKRTLNDRQIRWTELLANYHYRITYRAGKENVLADTLTRKLEDLRTQKAIRDAERQGQLLPEESLTTPSNTTSLAPTDGIAATTSAPQDLDAQDRDEDQIDEHERPQGFELIDAILKANRESKEAPESSVFWSKAQEDTQGWKVNDQGLLIKTVGKDLVPKLFVPPGTLRTLIIEEVHARMPTAHPGRDKTRILLASQYYWPTLSADVAQYLQNCLTCRRSHAFRDKKPGLLKPLPIPERPWSDISVDFKSFLRIAKVMTICS